MGRVTRTNFGWTVTRRLTNAEILTLFTAPITLIPARAGVIFVPAWIGIVSETTAAVYATVATIDIGVIGDTNFWGGITLANSGLASNTLSALIDATNTVWGADFPAVGAAGLGLVLSADADPTGGDPANYAIVTVEGLTLETV